MSFDVLTNITYNILTGDIEILNDTDTVPEQNTTFLVGTYPSQDSNQTALGTENAAFALWHFAQSWFQEFPEYHPNDSRISIATESYGGRYGPGFAAFFEEQNQRIENGTWTNMDGEMYILNLDTLMIINGCIDRPTQWPAYPKIVVNNTYGIMAVNETIHQQMVDALYRPGGCLDQIEDCRALTQYDPQSIGINATVNQVCSDAENFCSDEVRGPYLDYSGRNYYDMATFDPDPFPAPFYEGFLNQRHVQAALGVPLNWTQSSIAVSDAFRSIGDYIRPGWIEDLAYLLDNGVKVTLAYGDRDYACNWIGGELVSLAINYSHTADFHSAGYAPIQVNDSYIGGLVRQYGNLSFSRVYESGHEIPAYQPETAYRIFNRALSNLDIATGTKPTYSFEGEAYNSEGEDSTWRHMNELPEQPIPFCYTLDPYSTCSEDQLYRLGNGTAVVRDYIVQDANSTKLFPEIFGGTGTGDGPSARASASASVAPAPGDANGLRPSLFLGVVAILVTLMV
jgi:hypothetical protein